MSNVLAAFAVLLLLNPPMLCLYGLSLRALVRKLRQEPRIPRARALRLK